MAKVSVSFWGTIRWSAIGTGWQLVAQVAALVVLARILTPSEFGVVGAAMLLVQVFIAVGEFGLNAAVIQAKDGSVEFVGSATTLSCGFGALAALLLWGSAPLAASLFQMPELVDVLRAYCLLLLCRAVWLVHEAVLQKELKFERLARIDRASYGIGYVLIAIGAAMSGLSYWSLVIGHLAQESIKGWLVLVSTGDVPRFCFRQRKIRALVRFGVGQFLSRCGSLWAAQADTLIVAGTLGAAAVGVYGRANQLATIPFHHLGQVLDKAIFPEFSRLNAQDRPFGEGFEGLMRIGFYFSVVVAVGGIAFSDWLVLLALGAGWEHAVAPLQILFAAAPFRMIHKISDPIARSAGIVYGRAWRQWVVAVVITAGAWFMSDNGLAGVASAVLVATMVDASLMMPLAASAAGVGFRRAAASLIPGVTVGGMLGAGFLISEFAWHENRGGLSYRVIAVLVLVIWIGCLAFLRKQLLPTEIRSAAVALLGRAIAPVVRKEGGATSRK
ncbi:MAG: lipopolysaccharide biosynthesis protein [Burkholderiaceae bacterium]|nr:lipopolysaccharide biosynthesis protein [Burkholderiaceae bacterium]